jgi:hypothetical protein
LPRSIAEFLSTLNAIDIAFSLVPVVNTSDARHSSQKLRHQMSSPIIRSVVLAGALASAGIAVSAGRCAHQL